MRYARRLLAFLTLLVASAFAALPGGWAIGPDYSIRFCGGKAEGTFSGLAGTVNFDPADPTPAVLDVRVEAASSTGNKLKDKHARGDSWFDAEKYPTIRFVSSAIARRGLRAGGQRTVPMPLAALALPRAGQVGRRT